MAKTNENTEALMRIVVGVVTGITLEVWGALVGVLILVNLVMTLVNGKRNKDIAEFCETWSTQFYNYMRYMTFNSNKRPFPFVKVAKNMGSFEE